MGVASPVVHLLQVKKIMERPKVGLWGGKRVVHEMQFDPCAS